MRPKKRRKWTYDEEEERQREREKYNQEEKREEQDKDSRRWKGMYLREKTEREGMDRRENE